MNSFRPKLWTGISAAVIISAAGLAACNDTGEAGEQGAGAPAAGEGGEGGAEGGEGAGEAGVQDVYVSVPAESRAALRIAHLRGFFQIAQAQDEGADYAAALAGQGMLEVYDVQPTAFTEAGIDEAVLRQAAETGEAADIEAAIAHMNQVLAASGADDAAMARALVSIAAGIYGEVITEYGVDAIEYQHSLGSALSAQTIAENSDDPALAAAKDDIDAFVAMWPSTEAPEEATPVAQVAAQASRIELALN